MPGGPSPPAPDETAPDEMALAGFVEPMLAAPLEGAASRAGGPLRGGCGSWLFEPKLDGLRCVAVRNGRDVGLWSRNRLSFNEHFPELVAELRRLPASNFVLDGEVVALVGGRPSFTALQEGGAGDVVYWVFDLPWLLGEDLRELPVEQRKALLQKAVPGSLHLQVVKPLSGDPAALFEGACREGWEGLVAKRAGSAYRSGRRGEWVKLKCTCRQELVIGGFTAPKGARTGFGALLLGYWQDGQLAYAGKVGTGFTEATLRRLFRELLDLETSSSPFAAPVGERGARFVQPRLVAEVAFTNWTPEGRLRHPSFLGLRPDKASSDVVREECVPTAAAR